MNYSALSGGELNPKRLKWLQAINAKLASTSKFFRHLIAVFFQEQLLGANVTWMKKKLGFIVASLTLIAIISYVYILGESWGFVRSNCSDKIFGLSLGKVKEITSKKSVYMRCSEEKSTCYLTSKRMTVGAPMCKIILDDEGKVEKYSYIPADGEQIGLR